MYQQQLDYAITRIDSGLMGAECTACYLLESDGEAAIIETGNEASTERVLQVLIQRDIPREKVRYVIPTHVHLDHAGGAGSLMNALPMAKLVIHPRGARHMIDPSKLIAGATAVYGEARFKAMYGEIKPVAEARIVVAEDNFSLSVGSRELKFRDTPGHANHHFCVWDEVSRGWFSGDTFGLAYPLLATKAGPFLMPTTSPVQFDPDALLRSIDLLMSYQPQRMYLTHYGAIELTQTLFESLCEQIRDYVVIAKSLRNQDVSEVQLLERLTDYTLKRVARHGSNSLLPTAREVLAMDLKLNSQGLAIWLSRQEKTDKP